jgi:3-hydroxymyristoyl/3-hydroxydecanoyl-(acyl carrier protein) dehydratase
MRFETLPHAYPFRLADRTVERTATGSGSVRAVVSAGGRVAQGGPLGAGYVGELMAQAALLLAGTDADLGKSGFLAALSDVVVVRPPESGDALTVSVSVAGRTGAVVKFDTSIVDGDGAPVAHGAVTVREGRTA